jgi:hypothetical protein
MQGPTDRSRALFGTGTTILLALVLLIPFSLRALTNAEPYPALLFPGGAGIVRTDGSVVQYGGVVLLGYDRAGNPTEIDHAGQRSSIGSTSIADQILRALDTTNRPDTAQ